MAILLVLVPISLVLLGLAIWAFVWAVRRGQFDDLDAAALDVLVEEPLFPPAAGNTTHEPIASHGDDDAA